MSAQDQADGVVASLVRLPVRLAQQVRDEAVSIEEDAETLARGHTPQRGRSSLRNVSWGWLAGLGTVTALGVVQPEIAGLLAASHLVERHVHNQELDEFVGGLGEGI